MPGCNNIYLCQADSAALVSNKKINGSIYLMIGKKEISQTFKEIFIQIDKHVHEMSIYIWLTPIMMYLAPCSGLQESTTPQYGKHWSSHTLRNQ